MKFDLGPPVNCQPCLWREGSSSDCVMFREKQNDSSEKKRKSGIDKYIEMLRAGGRGVADPEALGSDRSSAGRC